MIKVKIKEILQEKLNPNFIKISNHSNKHKIKKFHIHLTHLQIIVVSKLFVNQSIINRHRMVQNIINTYIQQYIYSISLYTYTNEEWKNIHLNKIFCISCINKK
ncbi:DNA-binding transcriptional regulator BolA [Buchnera aphidicola (Eriosoma lanigerum)]|uniref:BolA family protein n=1 Tax=Buchnera aphidicola TaxID=9 RepID=UPI003464287E